MAESHVVAGWLTNDQAAAYIGVKAKTLQVWRSRDKDRGPVYHKHFRMVRYRVADLDAWLREREEEAVVTPSATQESAQAA